MNIGIIGIGVHLPEEVRKNDWWPADVVARWQEAGSAKVAAHMTGAKKKEETPMSEGAKRVIAGLQKYAADPFRGTRERRVMPKGSLGVDMELRAAAQAIESSGIAPSEIDLCLTFAICPDYINASTHAVLHHRLGLAPHCISADVNTVCNSFHSQLAMAEGMIRARRARYALLVQSSSMSRMAILEDPSSAWFGDGASAVVVGPVESGYGVLGFAHRNDGTLQRSLVHGVPGGRWFDEGKVEMYTEDRAASRQMLLMLADQAKETVTAALADARLPASRVDFYAGHQSTAWMLSTLKEYTGLSHAKSVETFSWAGTVSAANLPLAMAVASREGLLRKGDVVATFAPGTGMTYASSVLRWSMERRD
jgi:3-oxoacyl-[acyl-carrier-protein] synthase III